MNDQQWMIEDLVKKWKTNQRYTIRILKAMPEEYYDFKPTEEVKSFTSQISHIASWLNNHLKKVGYEGLSKLNKTNKTAIITSINIIFEEIVTYLDNLDPMILQEEIKMWYGNSTKLRLLNLMDNHLAHHRGQMVVYLRLKGIKPPSYSGW